MAKFYVRHHCGVGHSSWPAETQYLATTYVPRSWLGRCDHPTRRSVRIAGVLAVLATDFP